MKKKRTRPLSGEAAGLLAYAVVSDWISVNFEGIKGAVIRMLPEESIPVKEGFLNQRFQYFKKA